eukprot:scaffold10134_cov146-Skeletonema_marinoi.AAC.2
MHLEKLLLHCLMSITTVSQKHTILQIAKDMPLASDYDTSFMGKDTVPLQYIKSRRYEHICLRGSCQFFSAGSYASDDPTSTSTSARAHAGPFGVVLTAAAVSLLVVW